VLVPARRNTRYGWPAEAVDRWCQGYIQCAFLAPSAFTMHGDEALLYDPEPLRRCATRGWPARWPRSGTTTSWALRPSTAPAISSSSSTTSPPCSRPRPAASPRPRSPPRPPAPSGMINLRYAAL